MNNMGSIVRSPFMSGGEYAAAEADAKTKEPYIDKDVDSTIVAYENRWTYISDALAELDAEMVEAEVLWGEQLLAPIETLRVQVRKLRFDIQMFLRQRTDSSGRTQLSERYRKLERVVFSGRDENGEDEFGDKVAESVKQLRDDLQPFLKVD